MKLLQKQSMMSVKGCERVKLIFCLTSSRPPLSQPQPTPSQNHQTSYPNPIFPVFFLFLFCSLLQIIKQSSFAFPLILEM
jgi:hypothetical protein